MKSQKWLVERNSIVVWFKVVKDAIYTILVYGSKNKVWTKNEKLPLLTNLILLPLSTYSLYARLRVVTKIISFIGHLISLITSEHMENTSYKLSFYIQMYIK